MFLSIIVPAYNVDKYINRCINSLLEQNIDDYEIIIIDDCSNDETFSLIRNRVENNIIVLKNPKNLGLSATRNRGIMQAKGEYIMFVDSDDYLEKDCLKNIKLFVKKRMPDVVYLKYYLEKNRKVEKKCDYISDTNVVYTGIEFLKGELAKRNLPIPACFAVYRTDFLKKNKLLFEEGLLHEDELWTPSILLKANTVGTLDLAFYHYMIRETSISQKTKVKNGLDLIAVCNKLINLSDEIEDKELQKLMNNHIAMVYFKAMCRGKLYRKKYRKSIDRFLPIKKACFFKDKAKAVLFALNLPLYYYVDSKLGNNI